MNKKLLLLVLFCLTMISAFVLRVRHINEFGLFGDEKQSVLIAVGNTNIGGMVDLMSPDSTFTPSDFWKPRGIAAWLDADARGDVSGNSLVHDMALKVMGFIFGKSDGSLRMVSVLFNMLTLLVMYLWAKRIRKNYLWIFSVLILCAIEPFFIIFSQQARNYTTSLFFTSLCNYHFYQLVFLDSTDKKKNKNTLIWVLSAIGMLFSTYLTALVLVGQLIFLSYKKMAIDHWKRLIIGAVIVLIPFGSWMYFGPGQYFLIYQADAAEQYRQFLATNGPVAGWVEASSVSNLLKKVVAILSDQFFWTNDLYVKYGFKIGGVLVLGFVIAVINWIKSLPKNQKDFFIFGLIQLFIPLFVLLLAAIHAETTTGFFLRYACFGLPFGIFISVGFAEYLFSRSVWIKIIALFFGIIQLYTLISLFLPVYSDKRQKYTYSFGREKNPYRKIAETIEATYEQGDTVWYPSKMNNFLNSKAMSEITVDVSDAQLVNLYLKENDSLIQRINPRYKDSVLIKKKEGKLVLIFDFKNGKYRY